MPDKFFNGSLYFFGLRCLVDPCYSVRPPFCDLLILKISIVGWTPLEQIPVLEKEGKDVEMIEGGVYGFHGLGFENIWCGRGDLNPHGE